MTERLIKLAGNLLATRLHARAQGRTQNILSVSEQRQRKHSQENELFPKRRFVTLPAFAELFTQIRNQQIRQTNVLTISYKTFPLPASHVV